MTLVDVRESAEFAKNGIVTLLLQRSGAKSKLAKGSMTNTTYQCGINLTLAYPECKDEDNNFSPKKAIKQLLKDYPKGDEIDDVFGFDIPVNECSPYTSLVVTKSGNVMDCFHVALFEDNKEEAKRICSLNVVRGLRKKAFKVVSQKDEEDDDE